MLSRRSKESAKYGAHKTHSSTFFSLGSGHGGQRPAILWRSSYLPARRGFACMSSPYLSPISCLQIKLLWPQKKIIKNHTVSPKFEVQLMDQLWSPYCWSTPSGPPPPSQPGNPLAPLQISSRGSRGVSTKTAVPHPELQPSAISLQPSAHTGAICSRVWSGK